MKKTALIKKINRKRYIKSQILKYIRQNLEIIEDLASNHTGYFRVPKRDKKWLCLIDWDTVYFVKMDKLPFRELVKREDILEYCLILKRWFK